jgi:hypothetical protein
VLDCWRQLNSYHFGTWLLFHCPLSIKQPVHDLILEVLMGRLFLAHFDRLLGALDLLDGSADIASVIEIATS